MGTIKVTCAKCNKEFDLDEKWKGFAEKYPERVTCKECKDGGSTTKKTSSTTKSSGGYSKQKAEVTAKMFKQAYDEVCAEFADVLADVQPYIGGWVSTIVINRSR